ncbi:Glycerophosphodiester phosphodiesterase [Neobacillus rhizosphaerae]|uniref:Glycerophosphodiester phosphodiesterase n=1 Tax=Neobacillus rhizosphaerae TaxID=2880965 RepID=A0ABN8KST2_9BACI|nr:glycerophosphodiester phosphodiesterase family protein [Neobacillus rhizosphaerae]CAH2715500.1 Glycerophosphodiester phosphodiesterase [Neobacillus rhizosphaerae]
MRSIASLLLFIFMVAFRMVKGSTRIPKSQIPIKIGHRGAAGYCPENTAASFKKAIELGVDYLEIDIQMTRDNKLVIIHDPTINRTTNGKGHVKDLTLKELQALDAGSWFHPKFSKEKILSFSGFLDEFAEKTGLLIELKKPSLYPGIEEKVANELLKRGLTKGDTDKIIVQSFDQNSLKRFHKLLPSVPIGVLVKKRGVKGLSNKELQSFSTYAAYVNPKITMINKRLIRRIHHHGFKTLVWTVRKKKDVHLLKRYNIDGIISDFPDIF